MRAPIATVASAAASAVASAVVVASLFALGCGGAAPIVVDEDAELLVELRGNRIVFNHKIEFGHDSDALEPSAAPILDAVCGVLGEHPEIYRVQVQGHTSTVGEEAHNQELSAARAESVAAYLRAHGVAAEVTSQGYGETYPLCPDETDECHARNRRVEFFVDAR